MPADELKSLQKALRRIIRAQDVHSRRIDRTVGLTLPQLVVLQCVRDLGEVTSRAISKEASLSPPTVVGILDKLELKGMIERYRSESDRRIVHTILTERGILALDHAPSPIGVLFDDAFLTFPAERRSEIVSSFETVAELCETSVAELHDQSRIAENDDDIAAVAIQPVNRLRSDRH
ncbi:MAG: hypothetical protein MnENMB40S_37220 [Rhizobiaceae bacterium MnEN-MB40S]|nr:MAG: hypothetical protein MnENMB40S_37220 [Rhizobiaceae bacterium MnEN-MB40S]